jgi:alpha-N-acetylglucosaminidase
MFLSGILVWTTFAGAVPATQSTDGILHLVKRRLPNNVDDFEFRLLENNAVPLTAKPTNDEYGVSSTPDGKIMVEGNSLIALASG